MFPKSVTAFIKIWFQEAVLEFKIVKDAEAKPPATADILLPALEVAG